MDRIRPFYGEALCSRTLNQNSQTQKWSHARTCSVNVTRDDRLVRLKIILSRLIRLIFSCAKSHHTSFTMAPLRTLAALALTFGVAQGFAPAASFAIKQTTRYGTLLRSNRSDFCHFRVCRQEHSKLRSRGKKIRSTVFT